MRQVVQHAAQVALADNPNHPLGAVDRLAPLQAPRQVHVALVQQRRHHLCCASVALRGLVPDEAPQQECCCICAAMVHHLGLRPVALPEFTPQGWCSP